MFHERKAILLFSIHAVCLSLACMRIEAEPGQNVVVPPHGGQSQVSIIPYSSYAAEPGRGWNLIDAQNADGPESFQSSGGRSFYNFGIGSGAYWVRFKIPNPGPGQRRDDLIISTDTAIMDSMALYCPLGNRYVELRDDLLSPGRGAAHYGDGFKQPAFRVPANFDPDRWFYARVAFPVVGAAFTLRLAHEDDYRLESRRINVLAGILLGAAAAMVLYNCFLFFAIGDKLYLAYVAQVILASLHQVLATGLYRTIMPGFWTMFPADFPPSVVWLAFPAMLAGCIFTRLFLETRARVPLYDWLLKIGIALAGLGILLGILGDRTLIGGLAYLLGSTLPIIIMAAAVSAFMRGYRPALYFLIAWSTIAVGLIIFVLRGLGILPHNEWTFNAIAFATVAETILLSFALGARIRALREERAELRAREKELSRMTITDDLTHLYNKRYFHRILPEKVVRARETGGSLTLIILDVDHFKEHNDTHGHPAGDAVLRSLANVMGLCIRESDIACRFGGEEFAIILPGAAPSVGERVAERIHAGFAHADFQNSNKVTVSIGVARMRPDEQDESLLKRADLAMYRAKELGRNQTVLDPD